MDSDDMRANYDPARHFKLTKPCSNCPFRKQGGIALAPGRVEGIIGTLTRDDTSTFHCHKTVHHPRTGGEWVDAEDGDAQYLAGGQESWCAGAMIYLETVGRPNVGMRLGRVFGFYDPEKLAPGFADVIDPQAT
jgi:hypothetical protein